VYADPGQPGAWQQAQERLDELLRMLRQPVVAPPEAPTRAVPAQSEIAQTDFMNAVERAKQYIFDGDIMQVVLSQRMTAPFSASPLSLYRALRALNPSPYMFYFDMGDFHVVGSSPEILVRLENGVVTLRPIAGTRPRGATREADIALEKDLLADPKERAEHVMLMDLGRNDVGRVAEIGSVQVSDSMVIERYSHVMHIVSNVEGKLKAGLDYVQAGAGIVADSVPESEWVETQNKARALLRAAEMAQAGLNSRLS
jgi:anthranilate synthase component 1